MESQLELIVKFSNELDEKVFPEILNKLQKIEFFVNATYSANRLYLTLSGDEELSKKVFEILKELKHFLREYKLGIRDFYVSSYEISFPCKFIGEVKIPIVKTVVCNGEI